MNNHQEQTKRIIEKLTQVRELDKSFDVFGADSHRYNIGDVVPFETISLFEEEYNILLPNCYKKILTIVGNSNGNIDSKRNNNHSNQNSAAGPFYGIYPFTTKTDDIIENPKSYLCKDVVLHPEMTDEEWNNLLDDKSDVDMPDDEYDLWLGNLFAGILPIGSQGCTYLHGLVLNGKHKGKVVNLDFSIQKPFFCHEDNFLDWYERWLDEIISGDLTAQNAGSFAYNKGGSEKDLINEYKTSTTEIKNKCLVGLLSKTKISSQNFQFIENEYINSNANNKCLMLHILTKSNYKKAKIHLIKHSETNLLTTFQAIHYYAKDKSNEWIEFIEKNINKINDENTLSFCFFILENSKTDYSKLILPFTNHQNEDIRVNAFFNLGELEDTKSKYVEYFIQGLEDKSNRVVHTTLQALEDIKDFRLLQHYKKLTERYPKETNYILCNLKHRLKEFNLSISKIKSLSYEEIEIIAKNQKIKNWYEFWK